MAGTVWAFSLEQQTALLKAIEQGRQQLAAEPSLKGKVVTVLPVRGDEDAFVEEALIGAVKQSGATVAAPNDEKDVRFKRILKDIRWDEQMKTLKAVDPRTIDELGRLKSTEVFLEARVGLSQKGRRTLVANLNLLAIEVVTKAYVFQANIYAESKMPGPSLPEASRIRQATVPLNIEVASSGTGKGGEVAKILQTDVKNQLASEARGVVDGAGKPDVKIALASAASVFDRAGNFVVFEGKTHVAVHVLGAEARLLGEKNFTAKGVRSLGEDKAVQSLAAALNESIKGWIGGVLKAELVKFEAVEFTLKRGAAVEAVSDLAPVDAIYKAVSAMDGVRSVALTAQDSQKGTFTYRVVYEKAKYQDGFLNAAMVKNAKQFAYFEDL